MKKKIKTNKEYLIEAYYEFMEKLYGTSGAKNEEFEKLVDAQFGSNPDRDIDIEVSLTIKRESGATNTRLARSMHNFVSLYTRPIPNDCSCLTFTGNFVEWIEGKKKENQKAKDRLAFQEQIYIVEAEKKNLIRKATNRTAKQLEKSNAKVFTKDDIEQFSGIIKFGKDELTV